MRVTQGMIANRSILSINRSYDSMNKLQTQLETLKKINRPSDDPVVAMKGVKNRTDLSEVEQFQRNTTEAYSWFDATDSAYDQATKLIGRARELATELANGTLSAEDRLAAEKEVSQLKNQMLEISNTQIAGKFIFNGTDVKNPPYKSDGTPTSNPMNTGTISVEVSKGVTLQINSASSDFFQEDIFTNFDALSQALKSNDQTGVGNFLTTADQMLDRVNGARADMGARANRLELIDERNKDQEVFVTKTLSENEDVDIEKVITDLKVQESVHNATLSVSARIIQPTLMDFLR